MRDLPRGAELLRQARTVLLEDLLAALPEDRRYDALMVANAMAIVAREVEAGDTRGADREALEGLLDTHGEADLERALAVLAKRLAEEIRAGRHDGEAAVHEFLSRDAAARLALSNPKLLDR